MNALVHEAARIYCEEQLTDYGQAKRKAVQRLGGSARELPDNAQIQQAVIEYQRLFGGEPYRTHLRRMRETALRMLKWLADFSPRLAGAAVSGAVTPAHRVQLHLFADKPESLDLFLHDHGAQFEQGERSYRYPDGREAKIPLACFEVSGIGVDAAVFAEDERHRPPLNPADGLAFRRLAPTEVEALLHVRQDGVL